MRPADRRLIVLLGVAAGAMALIAVVGCVMNVATQTKTQDAATADHVSVQIGERTFNLELALTPSKRERGLMYRQTLAEDGGMLFVFPDSGVREFWMRNCLIDLDILFMDESGQIVSVKTMTAPPLGASSFPQWSSDAPTRFAIEIRAGSANKLGVETGQIIEIPLETLKRRAR